MDATSTMNRLLCCAWMMAMLAAASAAEGAAFAVAAQSASAGGNANAGVTASAEDASTAWFNPAGMVNLESAQAVQVLQLDMPSIKFRNGGSLPALGQPLGSEGGSAGHFAVIPQLYFVAPLQDKKLALGLTLNVPYGLKTDYEGDWMGRFQALESEVATINVNPSIAYRATDNFWIGAGLNLQYFRARLTNAVNYTAPVVAAARASGVPEAQIAVLLNPGNPNTIANLQGTAQVSGSEVEAGWNVGAIYRAGDLRLGVQYRSEIRYDIDGNASFQAPTSSNDLARQVIAAASAPGAPLADTPVSVAINLPQSASVGAFWKVNATWDVLFDAQWTQWSAIPLVRFVKPDGTVFNTIVYNWKDSWRFSAGANYSHSEQWKFRMGVAWDQTVIRDEAAREARLPDSDRLWLAGGARYRPHGPCLLVRACWIDVALSYVRPKDASIDRNNGSTERFGLLNGSYSSNVFIVGLQATAAF